MVGSATTVCSRVRASVAAGFLKIIGFPKVKPVFKQLRQHRGLKELPSQWMGEECGMFKKRFIDSSPMKCYHD
jgi:hypothetical protein